MDTIVHARNSAVAPYREYGHVRVLAAVVDTNRAFAWVHPTAVVAIHYAVLEISM